MKYGFHFRNSINPSKPRAELWEGSGNTQEILDRVIGAIYADPGTSAKFSNIDLLDIKYKRIVDAYDLFLNVIVKGRSTSQGPIKKTEWYIKQELTQEEQLKFNVIHKKFEDVKKLAIYLFPDNFEEVLFHQTDSDGNNLKLKEIGDMPTFKIKPGVLLFTPKLFDFNMSSAIISMYEQDIIRSNRMELSTFDITKIHTNYTNEESIKHNIENNKLEAIQYKYLNEIINDLEINLKERLDELYKIF